MERKIPDLKRPLAFWISSNNNSWLNQVTPEEYVRGIQRFEWKCETKLIRALETLDIRASVKSDAYSLPYTDEIVVKLPGESWIPGAYEFSPRVIRRIAKELLNRNIFKMRFYLFINTVTEKDPDNPSPFQMGYVEYRLRFSESKRK